MNAESGYDYPEQIEVQDKEMYYETKRREQCKKYTI